MTHTFVRVYNPAATPDREGRVQAFSVTTKDVNLDKFVKLSGAAVDHEGRPLAASWEQAPKTNTQKKEG